MCDNCKWELRKPWEDRLLGSYKTRTEAQDAAMDAVRISSGNDVTGRWLSTTCFVVEHGNGEIPETVSFHIVNATNAARLKQIMG